MKDNFFESELLEFALVFTYVGRISRDITTIHLYRMFKVCPAKILSITLFLLSNSI